MRAQGSDVGGLRCSARSPQGVECGLPKGHWGQHQNGWTGPKWEDERDKSNEFNNISQAAEA